MELDLDVFSGPFDLLLTLVRNDGLDLLDVEVAEVVATYLDVLKSRGDLDLEAATEIIVMLANLLELKSRRLLPRDPEDNPEIDTTAATDELLARIVDAARFRSAAAYIKQRLAAQPAVRYRQSPLPSHLRKRAFTHAPHGTLSAERLGCTIGRLLAMPPSVDINHLANPHVTLEQRLAHLRALLAQDTTVAFDEAVNAADRMTVAVTLYALLKLYQQGDAGWTQTTPFGDITILATPLGSAAAGSNRPESPELPAKRTGVGRRDSGLEQGSAHGLHTDTRHELSGALRRRRPAIGEDRPDQE